jgi:hypothetical protein
MPQMAHFTRFNFSLGLKSLIFAISNFRWASNRPFQPFSFFIGPQIIHFSRFRFSLELSPYWVIDFSIAIKFRAVRLPAYLVAERPERPMSI